MGVNSLRFQGTGKPVRPYTNPRVNREPSRKGISYSGIGSMSEFNKQIAQRTDASPRELGRGAHAVSQRAKAGINIFA